MIRIKHSQIGPLAKHIFKRLQSKNLWVFTKLGEEMIDVMVQLLEKNFEEEEQLNIQARKLLEQNKAKLGLTIDEEKAFNMIKKQLAKDKNFVL